ncbi:MAG: tetratricopeptide repeat protein [Magnetococcales bacterium]|nr:tetratricopeptide repeat protein [Magnetococcales bacterium]
MDAEGTPKPDTITIETAYTQAIDHFTAGRYTEADKLCTAIIKALPNHLDAINLLGLIAQKLNRHDLAIELFQRAANIDSNRAILYYNLGISLKQSGRKEEAIRALQTALDIEPGNRQISEYINAVLTSGASSADEILQQAISAHQSGQIDAAIQLYNRALEIQPENSVVLSNLGVALQAQGKLDEAAASCQKAIKFKPDYLEAYSNLGNILQDMCRYDEAVENYQKALLINPGHIATLYNFGTFLQRVGELDAAVLSYRRVIAINPNLVEPLYNLGTVLQAQGKLDEAVASYQKVIAIKPGYADAYCNLGVILHEQGKLDEAAENYQKALAFNPNYAFAYYNLGTVLQDQGEDQAGVACYQKAITINPEYADAYCNLGNALKNQGKLEDAANCYQKAISLKPDFAGAHYNFGVLLQDHGKYEDAVNCYQKAISIKPDFAEVYSNLGSILHEQSKLEEAIVNQQKAISIKPDYAEAYFNLGNSLISQGEFAVGIASYRHAIAIKPNYAAAHSNLIFSLPYVDSITGEEALSEAKKSALQFGSYQPVTDHSNTPDPDRPLRIGYVSPDFREHAVAYLLEPLLKSHNNKNVEIFCYAEVLAVDHITKRFIDLANHWCSTVAVSDDELVQIIINDKIDVLVDCGGYTSKSRLAIFSRKPAPIQISYLCLHGTTTGLAAMDYAISNKSVIPPGFENQLSEKVLFIPDTDIVFQPSPNWPMPTKQLKKKSEGLVFACVGDPLRISLSTIDLWKQLLDRVPNSKIIFKHKMYNNHEGSEHWRNSRPGTLVKDHPILSTI